MVYRNTLHRLTALVLTVLLAFACTAPAFAAAQKEKITGDDILCPGLEALFGNWYYATDTVPVELELHDVAPQILTLYDDSQEDGWDNAETPTLHELTFVSGDDFLKNAVKLEEVPGEGLQISLDEKALTQTGHAVYQIILETDSYRMEAERDLWVVSFEKYPAFAINGTNVVTTVGMNEILDESELLASVLTDNTAEIEEKLNQLSGYELFSIPGGLCTLSIPDDEETFTRDFRKTDWDNATGFFKINRFGTYEFPVVYYGGNAGYETSLTVNVLSYTLEGPTSVKPGETAKFSVRDEDASARRTFTWTGDGEDATFDPATATLTVDAEAYQGATYTVTATPSDGGAAVKLDGVVTSGALDTAEFQSVEMADGFTVPLLSSLNGKPMEAQVFSTEKARSSSTDQSDPYAFYEDVAVLSLSQFIMDSQEAVDSYDRISLSQAEEISYRDIDLGGRTARIAEAKYAGQYGTYYMGYLLMACNNHLLRIRVFSEPQNKKTGLPKVTFGDMEKIAALVTYDEEKAPVVLADGQLTISTKNDAAAVTAGKKLQFSSSFASGGKLKKLKSIAGLTSVEWTVTDAENGDPVDGVTISDTGLLSSDKKLEEAKSVIVTASSPVFGTSAAYPLTVIPAVSKLTAEPEKVYFYVGTDTTETVKAVLVPDTVPPVGITWKLKKSGVVEVVPGEDGTAILKPLAAGKTSMTVAEPGGKKAVVTIAVVEPVTGLELSLSGKKSPGGSVSVKASFTPKKPGNTDVEWSLDVGEDIAVITGKGTVKISKTAPAGTVITVTCKALGAPEPIEKTIEFTVSGK